MSVLLTRVAIGVTTVAVSGGFLVGTSGSASAAGCARSFGTYSTVEVGSTGAKARAVECLLHEGGYAATQNASFSAADAGRLKSFQSKHRLTATGRTDARTWAALVAQGSRPALSTGDRGSSVRRLQLSLRALGHRELPGTTYYGSKTAAAVRSLQKQLGQRQTGRADATLWAALQVGGRSAVASAAGSGTSTTSSTPTKKTTSKSKGAKAVAFAKKQLGEKYRYAGAGPNAWDCSGLTMKAWAAAGVKLPHSAKAQYKKGTKVKKSDLRPGDLVFFYSGPSHVGIYAGGGQVIHSPRPGKKVSYIKIKYMPYKGARRPG